MKKSKRFSVTRGGDLSPQCFHDPKYGFIHGVGGSVDDLVTMKMHMHSKKHKGRIYSTFELNIDSNYVEICMHKGMAREMHEYLGLILEDI